MAGRGWLWVAVGGCGWWRPNHGWSWMVVGAHSLLLIFMVKVKSATAFLTPYVPGEGEHFIFKERKMDIVGLIGRLVLVSYCPF